MPGSLATSGHGPSRSEIERVARHLRRLEAIAARLRFRQRIFRLVRGSVGAGAALLLLIAADDADPSSETIPLSTKLVIATLVGLAFAWPYVTSVIFELISILMSIFGNEPCRNTCCCECFGPHPRRDRLWALIAQRRDWLDAPTGEAPRIQDGRRPPRR